MAKASDYDGRTPEPPYDVGDDMTSELAVQLAEMQTAIRQLREQDKLLRQDWAARVQQGLLDRSMIQRLQEENRTLSRIPKGEVWYWQGDGQDFPESLGCPVIMEPDVLRAMLRVTDQLRAGIERVISGEADVEWLAAWYATAVKPK